MWIVNWLGASGPSPISWYPHEDLCPGQLQYRQSSDWWRTPGGGGWWEVVSSCQWRAWLVIWHWTWWEQREDWAEPSGFSSGPSELQLSSIYISIFQFAGYLYSLSTLCWVSRHRFKLKTKQNNRSNKYIYLFNLLMLYIIYVMNILLWYMYVYSVLLMMSGLSQISMYYYVLRWVCEKEYLVQLKVVNNYIELVLYRSYQI